MTAVLHAIEMDGHSPEVYQIPGDQRADLRSKSGIFEPATFLLQELNMNDLTDEQLRMLAAFGLVRLFTFDDQDASLPTPISTSADISATSTLTPNIPRTPQVSETPVPTTTTAPNLPAGRNNNQGRVKELFLPHVSRSVPTPTSIPAEQLTSVEASTTPPADVQLAEMKARLALAKLCVLGVGVWSLGWFIRQLFKNRKRD